MTRRTAAAPHLQPRRGWIPLRPDFPPLESAPALRRRPAAETAAASGADTRPWRRLLGRLGPESDLPGWIRATSRRLLRHRRLLAALCAALAVACGVDAAHPRPSPMTRVVVAARDLAQGAVVEGRDLRLVAVPTGLVPAGALRSATDAAGRRLSGAVRRGEPLTDVRLDGGPLSVPGPGLVSTPVRFADAAAARLLQPGEHVDVLAARAPGSGFADAAGQTAADLVAADVTVIALPGPAVDAASAPSSPDESGELVVLATTAEQARVLAQAAVTSKLSAIVVN